MDLNGIKNKIMTDVQAAKTVQELGAVINEAFNASRHGWQWPEKPTMYENRIKLTRDDVASMVNEVARRIIKEDWMSDYDNWKTSTPWDDCPEPDYETNVETEYLKEYTAALQTYMAKFFPESQISAQQIAEELTRLGGLKNNCIKVEVTTNGYYSWEAPDEDGYSFRNFNTDGEKAETDTSEYDRACQTLGESNPEIKRILEAFNGVVAYGIDYSIDEYGDEGLTNTKVMDLLDCADWEDYGPED